ncbi:hypothetical protein OCL06_11260 [Alteromonas sp. ASW11-19]|uniref:Uncharacterized protein n=1 Tax=Alteromonas salexigens TaxID=2982530 RepID=A0ABT2VQ23_9ALTE|nr:hypothetical protein [Alteromonas salexigens]MCU7555174.1 hypothetical protein [Alteromonas salexigens]
MLVYFAVTLLSSVFFYIEALKCGMNARVWGLAACALGPALLPLFTIQRHILWRRDSGFNNLYLKA